MSLKKGTSYSEKILGTDQNDIIYGYAGRDILIGGLGNDILKGGNGNDTLYSGRGRDTLYGQEGDDKLYASDYGNTTMYGGAGNDQFIFESAGAGSAKGDRDFIVDFDYNQDIVDLSHLKGFYERSDLNFVQNSGNLIVQDAGHKGQDDLYIVFKNRDHATFLFKNQSDDILTGTSGNDTIKGGLGNDVIEGDLGNDYLDGGNGFQEIDTVSYENAPFAVMINFTQKTAQNTGGAGIDTIVNFEKVIGSDYDDTLIGKNSGDPYGFSAIRDIHAGKGDDIIIGKSFSNGETGSYAGYQELYGDEGNDVIEGGMFLYGGDGNDILTGSGTSINDYYGAWARATEVHGGAGDDIIHSTAGHSAWLWGDSGNDTFKIEEGSTAYIRDFQRGADKIDLTNIISRELYEITYNAKTHESTIHYGSATFNVVSNAMLTDSDIIYSLYVPFESEF